MGPGHGASRGPASESWLSGPIAPTSGIGPDYFASLASKEGLSLHSCDSAAGVLSDFAALRGATFDPSSVHPSVARFYEQTAAYDLDAWAEWCGLFRPFGWLLAVLFSRRSSNSMFRYPVSTPVEALPAFCYSQEPSLRVSRFFCGGFGFAPAEPRWLSSPRNSLYGIIVSNEHEELC